MESENLLEYVSIERTWFYKQGVKAAEAKFEKKLELQEQRRLKEEAQRLKEDEQRRILFEKEQAQRRKEDEQRRKEDEQRRKEEQLQLQKQEQLIAALLLNNVMKKDKIAILAGSNLNFVERIEAKILKTTKLLSAQLLTTEEIAVVMKVSNDFVKLVAEKNND